MFLPLIMPADNVCIFVVMLSCFVVSNHVLTLKTGVKMNTMEKVNNRNKKNIQDQVKCLNNITLGSSVMQSHSNIADVCAIRINDAFKLFNYHFVIVVMWRMS